METETNTNTNQIKTHQLQISQAISHCWTWKPTHGSEYILTWALLLFNRTLLSLFICLTHACREQQHFISLLHQERCCGGYFVDCHSLPPWMCLLRLLSPCWFLAAVLNTGRLHYIHSGFVVTETSPWILIKLVTFKLLCWVLKSMSQSLVKWIQFIEESDFCWEEG